MNKAIVRYLLFLIAYIPIYIIAAIKTIDSRAIDALGQSMSFKEIALNNRMPISLVAFSIVLILYFKIYSWLALKPKGNPIFTIKKIKPQDKEYVTYLGTYLLPFVALETKTALDIIAVAFMFLTIGYIFSKTNLIYTNPTLAFFGYDIFEIETETGQKIDCISKEVFKIDEKPKGLKLGENTFIISKWKKDN